MDHWGDPWADNADDALPTKHEAPSPLPSTLAPAPTLLNGFLDDAGWGNNEDEGFGVWATSPRKDVGNAAMTAAATRLSYGDERLEPDKAPDSAEWDVVSQGETLERDNADWSGAVSAFQEIENVVSETSDSATTVQPEDTSDAVVEDAPAETQPDDESSARPSTSPSEASRIEAPVESPRTSIEDERVTQGPSQDEHIEEEDNEAGKVSMSDITPSESDSVKDELGDSGKDAPELTGYKDQPDTKINIENVSAGGEVERDEQEHQSTASTSAFNVDPALMAELFPPVKATDEPDEAPGDPIYSTPARKAWYRLTRKQTMREFNVGNDDDNYIRVTWANSHVRAEVNKVVGRWAREDRLSGTGPGARASFYWDSPAPAEANWQHNHSRKTSSTSNPVPVAPVRHSMPPLSTTAGAAFDWSSPSGSVSPDPWTSNKPDLHSALTPTTLRHPAVTKVQRQEGRAVSVDLTPRKSEQTVHKRTVSVLQPSHETSAATNLISPPPAFSPSIDKADPWLNSSIPDNSLTTTPQLANVPADDDEEWGEMVQSPTVSTSFQLDPLPHSTKHSNIPSVPPPPTRLSMVENLPTQAEPIETMDAAPIVRLKSTISPTSALFKKNAYIPQHAEQGPIGPSLLKPANRSARSTPEKKKSEAKAPPTTNKVEDTTAPESIAQIDGADDFSAWDSSETNQARPEPTQATHTTASPISIPSPPPTQSTRPSTPPPPAAPPQTQPLDAWADADFSIFESALPPTATPPPRRVHDPSDPFSFFDTPDATSARSTPKSFTRSPPRNTTPPPLQPLTGATNSVQRRKAEEDQIIGEILAGLPDLSYMLR